MTPYESLIVTLLGMGVVFLGLLLCIVGIEVFNRLAKRISWGEASHGQGGAPAAAPEVSAVLEPPMDPVSIDPSILAAIAAALEIEYRLYAAPNDQRLTIRRSSQS